MKMKLLCVPMVMTVMSALVVMNSGLTTTVQPATSAEAVQWTRTTGPPGLNLNGKMFTLSYSRGGISFYPPYYFSPSSPSRLSTPPYPTRRYTTRPYFTTRPHTTTKPRTTTTKPRTTTTYHPWTTTTKPKTTTTKPRTTTTYHPWTTTTKPRTTTTYHPWTTTTYPPWTTAPSTRGVSVCLRYMIDQQASVPRMFTLSPSSRTPLRLGVGNLGQYRLTFDTFSSYPLFLKPYIRLWSDTGNIWTQVCVTVDTVKNVVQVFSGSRMSIRKRLPVQYAWSGEPVIDFSGFDGQVTDVQVWDYPLRNSEIYNYMNSAVYGPFCGSVLTWSSIGYSPRGNTLLEDAYEWQVKQPISSRGRGRRPKGEKKTRLFYASGERKDGERQLL